MRLTTKGRYAVTAMLDLAVHRGSAPISLIGISRRQEISLSYLEQLFSKLRQHKLVASKRGPGGGYELSRDPSDIYIAQIVDAVDEPLDVTSCQGKGNCQRGEVCLTHYLWSDLSEQIHDFLSGVSLASLVMSRDVQEVAKRQEYSRLSESEGNLTIIKSSRLA
jgi:Rrf2 family transcriptional regulator, iron-sulfur cluster assembly transcription factor